MVDNEQLSQTVDTSDEWIRTRTGIVERRFAGKDQTTSDLSLASSQSGTGKCSDFT